MKFLKDTFFIGLLALFSLLGSFASAAEQEDPAVQETAASSAPLAQTSADTANVFFNLEHRTRIYEEARLKHSTAALYTLALPGLGNIYAEQYFYAGLSFTMMTFSLIFIGFGLNSSRPDVAWLGVGTGLFTYGASMATSMHGVSQYNDLLRQGLKISGDAVGSSTGPTIGFSFQF